MIEIKHDNNPPQWMSDWPSKDALDARFLPGIIMLANRAYLRAQYLSLTFTPRCMHATIDSHHVTWRIDDGAWSCSCNCGSPVKECMHAYMAAHMFTVVCREMGWKTANSKPTQPRAVQTKQPAVPSATVTTPKQLEFSNLPPRFANAIPPTPVPKNTADTNASNVHRANLEVEVDFRTSKVNAVIRFFVTEENVKRQQIIVSYIKNQAYNLSNNLKDSLSRRIEWNDNDREFLCWLYPRMRKMSLPDLCRKEMTISREEMLEWLGYWENKQERFIDRYTGKKLKNLSVAPISKLHFRLFDHGHNVLIAAILTDSNGKDYHYSQLRKMISENPMGFLIAERLKAFKSPLPLENVDLHWRTGSMSFIKQAVCEQLPRLLEGHLELLDKSDFVDIAEEKIVHAAIFASADNWSFTLSVKKVDEKDKEISIESGISYGSGRFHVKPCRDNGDYNTILNVLKKMTADCNGSYYNGEYRIRANAENIGYLRNLWKSLPATVKKHPDKRIAGILCDIPCKASVELSFHEKNRFMSVSVQCRCGSTNISLSAMRQAAAANVSYVKSERGEWFAIDPDELSKAMLALSEYGLGDDETIMLMDHASAIAKKAKSMGMDIEDNSIGIASRLASATIQQKPEIPSALSGILRQYQQTGVKFLIERCVYGIGSILADDMGLGKTLQILAVINSFHDFNEKNKIKVIVVSPASVIDVWLQQAARFCPNLKIIALRGEKSRRRQILIDNDYDILVTHYGLLRTDIAEIKKIEFDFAILDEAQAIKNANAQVSSAVRALHTGCRIALTGTPLENSISDLWSIMDFINPGFCGSREAFMEEFKDKLGRLRINRRLELTMLRRTKQLVAKELPPKTEEVISVEMPPEIRKLYNIELAKARMEAKNSGFTGILSAITRLRRFCCAPELVINNAEEKLTSPKLEFIVERISELIAGNHSILVFSQYTSLLDLLVPELDNNEIRHFMITGEVDVKKRAGIVDEFESCEQPSVFLLSLKAAGTGLTLTKADYVFLFDPWWNPAVENQAIDRTHRIGQDKPVFAYRLIVKDSIEEKVLQIVESKRQLFASVIDNVSADGNDSHFSLEELKALLG